MAHQIVFVNPDGTTESGPKIVHSTDPPVAAIEYNDHLWDRAETIRRFSAHVVGDVNATEATIRALNRLNCWRDAIDAFIVGPSPNLTKGHALLSFWNTYGLQSIPKGMKDQLPHLGAAFKALLPPYTGGPVTLYRGELASRYETGICGLSWTPILKTAQMFARRRWPDEGRGVVLKLDASPDMIIAAIRDYSEWTLKLGEDEYLVDPRSTRGRIEIADQA